MPIQHNYEPFISLELSTAGAISGAVLPVVAFLDCGRCTTVFASDRACGRTVAAMMLL